MLEREPSLVWRTITGDRTVSGLIGVYLVILGFELEVWEPPELERLRELERLLDPDELELEVRRLDDLAVSDNSSITAATKTRIRIVVSRIVFITAFLAWC